MKKYVSCFNMGIQKSVEYRFDFFVGYISAVFPIIIQVSMWAAIYGATKDGMMFGYTYQQMILYTFFVGVVGRFLSTGFEYDMNEDIKSGGLNKFIVKPLNYCIYRGSSFLGERTAVLGGFFILLAVLMGIFAVIGFFQMTMVKAVCFFLSLFLSLLLNFAVYFCIGISGLWLSEISRLFPAISIVITVISGGIFPLDILGEEINRIISFFPFKYMLQLPVDMLVGKGTGQSYLMSLGMQIFWVGVFVLLANILWHRGIKKYIAVGG